MRKEKDGEKEIYKGKEKKHLNLVEGSWLI